jgi:exodeoxyribonuclease VII large subunit
MEKVTLQFSVSECIALLNQILDTALPTVYVEGEVHSFKVNHNQYVFFDLKDEQGTLGCFMTVYQLRIPLEDGMRVVIEAQPRLTAWGKFSLTVRSIRPIGEGALKRAFELQKATLAKEGLFDEDRKRVLPDYPEHIAVISSKQSAGYADFMKIVRARWPLMSVDVHHVAVQGQKAADEIIGALNHINEAASLPQIVVLIRGGGSADDLAIFNDELLVRALAASRVPTLTGIGHEIDESLCDLVADRQASTPSNAAELLTPDKDEVIRRLDNFKREGIERLSVRFSSLSRQLDDRRIHTVQRLEASLRQVKEHLQSRQRLLHALHPTMLLRRGYALVKAAEGMHIGATIHIETDKQLIEAEVQNVRQK